MAVIFVEVAQKKIFLRQLQSVGYRAVHTRRCPMLFYGWSSIYFALRKVKKGKTAGIDGFPVELITEGKNYFMPFLEIFIFFYL